MPTTDPIAHAADPFTPVACPLPGCNNDLHLINMTSRPVYLDEVERGDIDGSDAYTSSWRIECEEGHVVLLPDYEGLSCPCGDDACNGVESGEGHADFDSEDLRTFREVDAARLRTLLAARAVTA